MSGNSWYGINANGFTTIANSKVVDATTTITIGNNARFVNTKGAIAVGSVTMMLLIPVACLYSYSEQKK